MNSAKDKVVHRELAPDVLRGFALLGIILVNIGYFAVNSETSINAEALAGASNWWAGFLVWMLAQGKFYLLFSILFGYSSHYVIKGEKGNRKRWRMRALGLILFGILHFTLLWHADILFVYGVFALLLTWFLFKSDRALKIWSWVFYFVASTILTLLALLLWFVEVTFGIQEVSQEVALDVVMQSGTYLESIPARLELWVMFAPIGFFVQGGFVLMMFLLGAYLARHNAFSTNGFLNYRKLMIYGFGFGLPLQALSAFIGVNNQALEAPSQATYLGSTVFGFATAPLLTFGLIGLILWLVENRVKTVEWMSYGGRMSLTIYISQSVFMSFIFGPWGLGLFQKIDYWLVIVMAIAIWLVLVSFARVWFSKYKQGPLERVLTGFARRFS
jgi:uncharacterized protein